MDMRSCMFCFLLGFDAMFVVIVKAGYFHEGWLWCDYQLILEAMSWKDAHAVCKQYNKTLLHLTDSDQYESVKTLVRQSISSMLPVGRNIESTVWVGVHFDSNNVKRYDNCQQYAPNGAFDPATDIAGCFLFDISTVNHKFTTAPCANQKQFLCHATVHDSATCFTERVHNFNRLVDNNVAYLCDEPSTVFRYCTSSCVGIQKNNGYCSMLRFTDEPQRPGETLITKALLVTSSPVLINPAIDITSVCGGGAISSSAAAATSSIVDGVTSSIAASSSIAITSDTSSINTSPIPDSSYCTTSSIFPVSHYNSQSTCFCACGNSTNVTMTTEELKEKIQELRDELIVKKDDLSSHKRKLISAPDDRTSAKNIGYVGAVFLGMVFVAIVMIDVPRMLNEVRSVTQAICGLKGSKPQVIGRPNHSEC